MDDFFELIAKRESCRNYSEKKVEREKLEKCIEAARLAPSACNSQPWSFTAVDSPEFAPQVAKCLQEMGMNKFTDNCPAFVIIAEEKATLSARVGGKVKNQDYAPIDIGLATAQLCLAATDQGLSTCIMGWFNESKLKELLDISKEKRIRLVIAVGYAVDEELRQKSRKSLEDIARFM
ncbi:MAG: NAD(P)H nitroreductase [Clostridiales bacterium]|nr:NAD(P)H nitroreductase [Clostridiales bacterium]